ncbi:strawberry notch-like NTP hydrolase domain-containing protein [Adhaeribacter pallidiroseus]|uniref:Helicase ATP-binding domain-containing protein n=1 Tax=Adhaeribacter pallidiroseus TaxID=2072847 RepID=A0A369QJG0_9BACT|nr:strawberry notch C-terminal domain-containing protein [Adhaeribacter pallidiroseus]RDC65073.1 hypothetical protein AHMF7616_03696 [Adhaeribacter pallidiroseus]
MKHLDYDQMKNAPQMVKWVVNELALKHNHHKVSLEKQAATFGITDQNLVKELTELAICTQAKKLLRNHGSYWDKLGKFNKMVELYELQANLSHRTSQSVMLQQYSTPVPLAYLAGAFCGIDKLGYGIKLLEPSAGNGLLTIASGHDQDTTVNEIDEVRSANLAYQKFGQQLKQDASQPFIDLEKKSFDAVITNPPFGRAGTVRWADTDIKLLEHQMVLNALEYLKDHGKAACIIGGHTEYDEHGRIQAGMNRSFFNYLCHRYHVLDVININSKKLYAKQGTGFNVRLILIDGRKKTPEGVAPLRQDKDVVVHTWEQLYSRVAQYFDQTQVKQPGRILPDAVIHSTRQNYDFMKKQNLEAEALLLELELLQFDGLGMPYIPTSKGTGLKTEVPDSMATETFHALAQVKEAVGGDLDVFVQDRLGYKTRQELYTALSAEQIDAVALGIYNIEAKEQAIIVGDQTGIGKGRVAASIIRYGVVQGLKPVFITEKPNLFSDLYRDLVAIGASSFKPFIVNGREDKTSIKDADGTVIHAALPEAEQKAVFRSRELPAAYDFICTTYSQLNSAEKRPDKPYFIKAMAQGSIVVMDESHNSSGESNTGIFLQEVVGQAKGVVFLSATFAKRPDNMPVYARKTAMSETNLTSESLVEAITRGGVALQEVLASQLVAEGQMIRRERSYEGVEVNYITLHDKEQEHRAIADNITAIVRDIIRFQTEFVSPEIESMDKAMAKSGKEAGMTKGTEQGGVNNSPYFSKVFQVINQLLFSIKAVDVAERAIARLKEGKKPIIAFASTMGSFVEQMEDASGMPVSNGSKIQADFSEVLRRGLEGVMKYTVTEPNGEKKKEKFAVADLSQDAQYRYREIMAKIDACVAGISISPIDIIANRLKKAGYSVAEITGRKMEVQINERTMEGVVVTRKKENVSDAFRKFNDNEIDVLMINQSGSTGASAHAIPTKKVSKDQVKQRVMLILQAELDINTEVQKRGRINRTGQILHPIYDYVISAIPAEKRLMMMLQKKLKSLDANTASNQKQSEAVLNVADDFLNKYGDKVAEDYLVDNPTINMMLNNPEGGEGLAHMVSGRVAVLSTKMQQDFYDEIGQRYLDLVEYLKQTGEYDLEMEAMPLDAETVVSQVAIMGKGGDSAFGEDTILEKCLVNSLKKPFTRNELDNLIMEQLGEFNSAEALKSSLEKEYRSFKGAQVLKEETEIMESALKLSDKVAQDKRWKKLKQQNETEAIQAIAAKQEEIMQEAQTRIYKVREKANNDLDYIVGALRFFYVGRGLELAGKGFSKETRTFGVCLGFSIDRKKTNPWTRSNIKLRIAIASSMKYMAIPLSMNTEILAIRGASYNKLDYLYQEWSDISRAASSDRTTRYIVTGNILQGIASFPGKLVNYTLKGGGTKKGILMPDGWSNLKETAQVPIGSVLKQIVSLTSGNMLHTNLELSLLKQWGSYRIIVPASKAKGGMFYLDPDMLDLVEENEFNKVGDRMRANVAEENIEKLVTLLDKKFKASVEIKASQTSKIDRAIRSESKVLTPLKAETKTAKIFVTDNGNVAVTSDYNLAEIEAEALILELELLAFN